MIRCHRNRVVPVILLAIAIRTEFDINLVQIVAQEYHIADDALSTCGLMVMRLAKFNNAPRGERAPRVPPRVVSKPNAISSSLFFF